MFKTKHNSGYTTTQADLRDVNTVTEKHIYILTDSDIIILAGNAQHIG